MTKNKIKIFFIILFFIVPNLSFAIFENSKNCYSSVLSIVDNKINILDERVVGDCQNESNTKTEMYYLSFDDEKNELSKDFVYSLNGLSIDNTYILKVNNLNKARSVIVYGKKNEELIKIDLKKYLTCGNEICDQGEDVNVCALDCGGGKKNGHCDRYRDNICDVDCLTSKSMSDFDCLNMDSISNKEEVRQFIEEQKNYQEKVDVKNEKDPESVKKTTNNFGWIVSVINEILLIFIVVLFCVIPIVVVIKFKQKTNTR